MNKGKKINHVITRNNDKQIVHGFTQRDIIICDTSDCSILAGEPKSLISMGGEMSPCCGLLRHFVEKTLHLGVNIPHNDSGLGSLDESVKYAPSETERGKSAFTLAEVLITLGVIGVLAAITLPVLNQAYRNLTVATKLKKFHSMMNQAIRMAENDYGGKKDWLDAHSGCDYIRPQFVESDMNGNLVLGATQTEKFFNKFFAPYLKISHVKHLSNGSFVAYFPDGSAISPGPDYPTTKCYNWMYFPSNPDRCGYEPSSTFGDEQGGKCRFSFTLRLGLREKQQPFGFQPFYYGNGVPSRSTLKSDCQNYGFPCSALIQYDGWHVAVDYPKNRKIRF